MYDIVCMSLKFYYAEYHSLLKHFRSQILLSDWSGAGI